MTDISWKYAMPPISEEDIRSLEGILEVTLPDDYKSFIREHNGARPKPNAIDLPNGREVLMERLISVEKDSKNNLQSITDTLKKQCEQSLVPFGSDPFGNLFCFEYSGKAFEAVVFWNHEINSTQKVCGTFSEMLNSLHMPA